MINCAKRGNKLIIDSHVHIGEPPKEAEPKNFVKLMQKSHIDKAVIFRYFYDKPTAFSNQYISSVVEQYPDFYIGFAWINPNNNSAAKELETSILKWKLKGVKLHLEMHPTPTEKLKKIFNVAEKHNAPICTHLGNDFDQIETLIKEFRIKLIIAHLGTGVYCLDINRLKKAISLAKKENVFLETSGNTYPLVDYAVTALSPKKIVFGSDFPHEHPLVSAKIVKLLNISEKEKDLILQKNISKILRI
jgi:predicted TIM-barrel fold metal-dependent hydrolase